MGVQGQFLAKNGLKSQRPAQGAVRTPIFKVIFGQKMTGRGDFSDQDPAKN